MTWVCAVAAAGGAACGSSRTPRDVLTDGGVVRPGDYADPLVHLGRLDTSTFIEIGEVRARDDGLVLFCTGVQGMNVVDASDPGDMKLLRRLASSRSSGQYPRCQHVAVDGDVAYMASRGDEIQPTPFVAAFDLARDGAEIATFVRDATTFEGMDAAGTMLYVAAHDKGLLVLERTATGLVERGVATGLTNAWGVDVDPARQIAFVADGAGGLAAVDVSSPASPAVVGRVDFDGAAMMVQVVGDVAYVAASQAGLVAVDISDPRALRVLSVTDTPGTALELAVSGGHAFVADWNDVRAFDVSDPAHPALLATERIDVSGGFPRVLGVGAYGDYAFAGEWTGLHALQLFPDRVAPDLWVGEREIDFGVVPAGDEDAVAVAIENQGRARLAVWSIETTDRRFSVDRDQVVVEPGQVAVVEVRVRPDGDAEVRGQLKLLSDDPDDGERTIDLRVNRPGVGVGDPAPEVAVQLLDGGQWRLSDHAGQVVLLAYFATF